jgi:hypothetical protein
MLTVITPATSQALVSLDTVKAELEVSGAGDDAMLTSLIRQTSDEISSFCDRVFILETVRETFVLDDVIWFERHWRSAGEPLLVQRRPVVEVLSLAEDGVLVSPSEYETDLQRGRIWRNRDGLRTGWFARRVTVEYRGGYAPTAIPGALERAALDLIKRSYYQRTRDPNLRSEEVPGIISQTFTTTSSEQTQAGVPADIADRLWRFRDLA